MDKSGKRDLRDQVLEVVRKTRPLASVFFRFSHRDRDDKGLKVIEQRQQVYKLKHVIE